MTQSEVSRLEHASRSAMAWGPEAEDRARANLLLVAGLPTLAVIVFAATLLATVL